MPGEYRAVGILIPGPSPSFGKEKGASSSVVLVFEGPVEGRSYELEEVK
jgi:hypothetical protein